MIPEKIKIDSSKVLKELEKMDNGYRKCPNCDEWVKIKHHHHINGIIINPYEDNGIRNIEVYECKNCHFKWENRY